MSRAGIVAALTAEARTLGAASAAGRATATAAGTDGPLLSLSDGTLLVISGVGLVAAAAAAHRLLDAGAAGLISFGLAGGLDPALGAGQALLPDEIRSNDALSLTTDPAWCARVRASLSAQSLPVAGGVLWSSRTPLLTGDAKRQLFADSGAAAVDMEAIAVASAARAAGRPFLAIKVIVDTAVDALPQAVMAVDAGGQIRAAQMAGTLLRHPGEIMALVRLGGRYRRAMRTLRILASLSAVRQPSVEVISP